VTLCSTSDLKALLIMIYPSFSAMVSAAAEQVRELMPWDVDELRRAQPQVLIVDIREPEEFAQAHIAGSLLVPRGVLEAASDWGYSDTVPALACARQQPVVLVCRSGNRTALAALALQQLGFEQVVSMKTGVRGWNDYELPLVDGSGAPVDIDLADQLLNPALRPEQKAPARSGHA